MVLGEEGGANLGYEKNRRGQKLNSTHTEVWEKGMSPPPPPPPHSPKVDLTPKKIILTNFKAKN